MSEYTDNATEDMDFSIEVLKEKFAKVRTGRANANILSDIRVDYYGAPTPINQLAAIKVPEAHVLVVEPWDKSSILAVEKAIANSDLGITPTNTGTAIRLPFPAPTEERRRELVKECRQLAEECRVAIRNARRNANGKIERSEELTEDDEKREKEQVQKITDAHIKIVDDLLKNKEAEVMEI